MFKRYFRIHSVTAASRLYHTNNDIQSHSGWVAYFDWNFNRLWFRICSIQLSVIPESYANFVVLNGTLCILEYFLIPRRILGQNWTTAVFSKKYLIFITMQRYHVAVFATLFGIRICAILIIKIYATLFLNSINSL